MVLAALVRVVLVHVHLHLEALVTLSAIEQAMLVVLVALVEHAVGAVGWRVGAWRAVGRGRVVGVEAYSRIVDGRSVSLVRMARVVCLLALLLVVILSGPWEPEATIGHLKTQHAVVVMSER